MGHLPAGKSLLKVVQKHVVGKKVPDSVND